MSYTVFARKYRPQTFADLVGQEHVSRTLGNAIASGRVAHAFLFTGVRGVGKTTSARILAKALNCEQGPTSAPCGECDPCKQITLGTDLDVLEMDGASNNSVEDVRRLQESIPFRPARDRFKIVIVDEVHMLSTGAFNAFLKTLEEPPAHVKFIFATTEAHKVPITIRSRCQRYDFKLIAQPVIAGRVRQILAAEGIDADDPAIAIITREANGSMRDALTLLDQVVAFSGERLVGSEVSRQLGIADREHLYRLAAAVLEGRGKDALEVVADVAEQGLDLLHFSRQWLDLSRDLVVLKVAGDQPRLVELTTDERARALALVERAAPLELERAFQAVLTLVDEVGKSAGPRVTLEMGVVRLATRPPLRDLAGLIARLESRGGPTPEGPRGGSPQPGPGRGPVPAPTRSDPPRPPPPPSRGPAGQEGSHGGSSFAHLIPTEHREPTKAQSSEPSAKILPLTRPVATASPSATNRSSAAAPALTRPEPPVQALAQEPNELSRWPEIVALTGEHGPQWPALYAHAVAVEVRRSEIVLAFAEGSFYGRSAESAAGRQALERAAAKLLGGAPKLIVRFMAELPGQSLAEAQAEVLDERKEAIRKRALGHPQVLEANKIFPELSSRQEVHIDAD